LEKTGRDISQNRGLQGIGDGIQMIRHRVKYQQPRRQNRCVPQGMERRSHKADIAQQSRSIHSELFEVMIARTVDSPTRFACTSLQPVQKTFVASLAREA
tara:strand:- start:133 stop:432 length:300 start_codon:yes stop_codon:yes gene_type:complete